MPAYLAPSLVDLRNEINAANPGRDKSSDGWIGDAAHAARVSDHNPDPLPNGVVRALDVDVDGCPPDHLIAVAIRDPRVEYVISRGKIYERGNGFKAKVYTGSNKHDKHTHISIRHTKTAEKSGPWGYAGSPPPPTPTPAPAGKSSLVDIARKVIAGEYGNNPQRSQRLAREGYSPTEVQAEVNRLLSGAGANTPTRPSNTVIAQQVIAGQWGNGDERKTRLTAAGFDAAAIQAEVNRLVRR